MRAARAVLKTLERRLPDRRCRLHDVSDPRRRRLGPRSKVLQFYSDHPNIGNWTPVLGIQRMLGHAPDAWSVYRRPIDFEYVNRTYRCVIVGGAGLLHRGFEPFWRELLRGCRLPTALWGVGGCFPDAERDREPACPSARALASRFERVDVRDELTAERFGLTDAHVGPCPTVVHLAERFAGRGLDGRQVLLATHPELTGRALARGVAERVAARFPRHRVTENLQTRWLGVDDLVGRRYRSSRLVVTTRLHGAIIAYGLRVPWIALARDEKLRAFGRRYGNGRVVEDLAALEAALAAPLPPLERPVDVAAARSFGARMVTWLRGYDALPGIRASEGPQLATPGRS